jgi:hypothetical protein
MVVALRCCASLMEVLVSYLSLRGELGKDVQGVQEV